MRVHSSNRNCFLPVPDLRVSPHRFGRFNLPLTNKPCSGVTNFSFFAVVSLGLLMSVLTAPVKCDGDFLLNSSFLDFALQYNIANNNRLILIDIFSEKDQFFVNRGVKDLQNNLIFSLPFTLSRGLSPIAAAKGDEIQGQTLKIQKRYLWSFWQRLRDH